MYVHCMQMRYPKKVKFINQLVCKIKNPVKTSNQIFAYIFNTTE